MCLGPGPARYSLPGTTGLVGHDKTKKASPSYSFGLKTGSSWFHSNSIQDIVKPYFNLVGVGKAV